MGKRGPKPRPLIDRLAEKFDIDEETGCWNWIGPFKSSGYGQFVKPGGSERPDGICCVAHRALYEEVVGPVPKELDLDHLCRNRKCINPDHLEPVTRSENCRRGETGAHWAQKRAQKEVMPGA